MPTYVRCLPASVEGCNRRLAEGLGVAPAVADRLKREYGILPQVGGARDMTSGWQSMRPEDLPYVLFGLLRGVVLVSIAWLGLAAFVAPKDHPAFIQEARSLPLVEYGARFLVALVPDKTLAIGRDFVDDASGQSGELVGERILRLVDPSGGDPKSTDSEENTGYKRAPRKQLERLIEDRQD